VPSSFRIEFPPELPISVRAQEIVEAIQAHSVLILAGETGSGKTTQIPKMCLAAGRGVAGRIACTQPRRVAALSLSRRVADELGVEWGAEVGCKVRFSNRTTEATRIKFLTDGMLLAETQSDPLLREYDTIVVDEAHERSLNIDFLLGHLRQLRHQRPDLRIVVTSATIDTEAFSAAFDGAPVIVVEGRMFPVEVIHVPLDALGSDAAEGDESGSRGEALHYVDGAAEQVERIVRERQTGDILVFMPSERDIRETCELLSGRVRDADVVPLFGRLSNAEQQRIFAAGRRRKIVVATNIAETSLTIPGIRFVVDTGLARISRYSPQGRTRRLPIEAISQSSADQRKGRCGRVAEGVCIRLYSEEDYLSRPRFTQPEIQRANLADVILRLKAGGLGDVERFPFISPPAPKAIRAGYALLEELGALEFEAGPQAPAGGVRALTRTGRELARLPVDPTVGRMILQARAERAVRELLIIASGLSIQDPRERPLDRRAQADAAHRRFAHPDSDFLGLLNLWEAFHADVERLSQGRLRAFCRAHFLSYTRMREWRDVHTQLSEALGEERGARLSSVFDGTRPNAPRDLAFGSPGYRAIHRSILAGLLGSIAHRDEENGGYRATHDRRVAIFPGSVLSVRAAHDRKSERGGAPPARKESKGPRWILAAEIMETTRLYARTCAKLDPEWAVDLGAHLVRVSHSEPFWDADAGRVLVKRTTRLYGLEIERRSVGFGAVDPAAAKDIFIREGIVGDTISWPFDFLAHNRRVRERIETLLTRARDPGYLNLDEAAVAFYAARLPAVSSVPELVDLVRERRASEPAYLMMEPSDLRDPAGLEEEAAGFPEAMPLENRAIPLQYAYKPGGDDDGATLEVNIRDVRSLTPAAIDWAVPGHLAEKIEHYLRALPKEMRRAFVPLADSARRLASALVRRDQLTGRKESLVAALSAEIAEAYPVRVDPSIWGDQTLPEHLRVRVRVLDDHGKEVAVGRDLAAILAAVEAREQANAVQAAREEPVEWRRARETWERPAQAAWDFGDIPERIAVANVAGVGVFAYPGLSIEPSGVALRLFPSRDQARAASGLGVAQLLGLQLRNDLAWLHRDLRGLRELGPEAATLQSIDELCEDAFESARRWLVERSVDPLTSAAYHSVLERSRSDMRGLAIRFKELMTEILALRLKLMVEARPYPQMSADLDSLIPGDFLKVTPYEQLMHFPRYLKGMLLRSERWRREPARDAERALRFAPYGPFVARRGPVRWLLEEFRVSVFAQDLGTAVPVSAERLDRALEAESTDAVAAPPNAAEKMANNPMPAQPAAPPLGAARPRPLKSLGALDKAFPRRP